MTRPRIDLTTAAVKCPRCFFEMSRKWLLGHTPADNGYAHICYYLHCEHCGQQIGMCNKPQCETEFKD
jgi:hypothetical protein